MFQYPKGYFGKQAITPVDRKPINASKKANSSSKKPTNLRNYLTKEKSEGSNKRKSYQTETKSQRMRDQEMRRVNERTAEKFRLKNIGKTSTVKSTGAKSARTHRSERNSKGPSKKHTPRTKGEHKGSMLTKSNIDEEISQILRK